MTTATKEEVLTIAHKYYAAVNEMFTGKLTLMEDVWSKAEDAVYMGPGGGYNIGWPAILKDWQAQAALKLGGKIEPSEINIILGDNIAIVHSVEIGQNANISGHEEVVKIRATNIYRKEADGWKILSCHTDAITFLQDM